MEIVKTFLFITLSPFFFPLISVATESSLGICKGKGDICCEGYYQENGTCKVCPRGWYGKNCTRKCPNNTYGELCRGICQCSIEERCDTIKGFCIPGTYGYNCKEMCQNGTYGYLCRENCNCSPGVICDKQFGCADQGSKPYELLIYTLTPVIPGIMICLIILFVCKYIQQMCRKRKSSSKNFVDIPPYDTSKHRIYHSNDDLQNTPCYKTETENYGTIKTEEEEIKLSAFSQEEKLDDGVYNKLTLRVTGYDEPVARKQLTRRYSDSSSTYMKSSDCNLRRPEEVHNPFQKHRRFSSLRIKNIDRENNSGEMNRLHTMEAGERNVCVSSTKSEECFPLALDGEYVYDMAKFEERDERVGLNNRQLFLKELSSHLLNHKNNLKKNMDTPE